MLQAHDVILFQGDSITDAGRNRDCSAPNDAAGLGRGYAVMAAAALLAARPSDGLQIHNRGVGGNKVWQLEERWQTDCLDLKPNLLSVLIGVNDTWHGQNDPALRVPMDQYERVYRKLLDDAKDANPEIRLVLCEPFTLRVGAVTDSWFPEIDDRRAIVKRIAEDYAALFVPFQSLFDDLAQKAPKDYWLRDGVHPTLAGHQQIARMWLDTVLA
ncbi:SGNH/GDSL hydrolase family protein [PVC group bacterium]|nr:SGNH/GDSL hydrolase family protein [PVC group bacterium]